MDPFDTGNSRERMVVLGIIVAFHVLLIYALNSSLSHILTEKIIQPFKANIIEDTKQEEEAPPPPPPKLEVPPPFVPPPDIAIEAPVDAGPSRAIQVVTNQQKPAAPPPQAEKVRVAPQQDPKYQRRFQPDYPPTSRRLGEAGTVVLEVVVAEDGTVQDATVVTSSGYERLDQAAVAHAKRAWRFIPGTEDGKPVAMRKQMKVTFKITD